MFYLKAPFVSCSKHSVSVMKASQFILYSSKVTVISEICMKNVNACCGHNVELFIITPDGTGSSH